MKEKVIKEKSNRSDVLFIVPVVIMSLLKIKLKKTKIVSIVPATSQS